MESARDKYTNKVIDAEELWRIQSVDSQGYLCCGCDAAATPCSFAPENKVRPYFRVEGRHQDSCDVKEEMTWVKRARTERLRTTEGFPCRVPNRLQLRDSTHEQLADPAVAAQGVPANQRESSGVQRTRRNPFYTAETIRPICRAFMLFPHNRDLPLSIPDVDGDTFEHIFEHLDRNQIRSYKVRRVFYAPLRWSAPMASEDSLEITVDAGEWSDLERRRVHPYRVQALWGNWSATRRTSMKREIEVARLEAIKASKDGRPEKGWLFFIGRQTDGEPEVFQVRDHRLICIRVAEMPKATRYT